MKLYWTVFTTPYIQRSIVQNDVMWKNVKKPKTFYTFFTLKTVDGIKRFFYIEKTSNTAFVVPNKYNFFGSHRQIRFEKYHKTVWIYRHCVLLIFRTPRSLGQYWSENTHALYKISALTRTRSIPVRWLLLYTSAHDEYKFIASMSFVRLQCTPARIFIKSLPRDTCRIVFAVRNKTVIS